jgi:hypothetical protein
MHGLKTIVKMNMSKEEIAEGARRSAAAQPIVPETGGADMLEKEWVKPGTDPGRVIEEKPQTV